MFSAQIVPIASTHCFAIVGCRYVVFDWERRPTTYNNQSNNNILGGDQKQSTVCWRSTHSTGVIALKWSLRVTVTYYNPFTVLMSGRHRAIRQCTAGITINFSPLICQYGARCAAVAHASLSCIQYNKHIALGGHRAATDTTTIGLQRVTRQCAAAVSAAVKWRHNKRSSSAQVCTIALLIKTRSGSLPC